MKRNTYQFLIPEKKVKNSNTTYDIYPTHSISDGEIETGYQSLANRLVSERILILDGYIGVDWAEVISVLSPLIKNNGKTLRVTDINSCLKPEKDICKMVEPFLGGEDPIFGFRANIELKDYFDPNKIEDITPDENVDIQIIFGTGASQCGIEGFLVYFDLPKNELQYRMKAGAIKNLGLSAAKDANQMYKHFYFVDWVVLNNEKRSLLSKISIIVDQQRPGHPTWMDGKILRNALTKMSKSYFRVRPWFQPGVWGGQWMKNRFDGLNKKQDNYAWSFEMIVPENGLLFESDGRLLEVSFDMLMYQNKENVLGKAAKRFGNEFPIRFNFLDTFDGDNLSVQCHPSPEYIKKEFGENFTQDETYYMLDSCEDAEVYLGFQKGIDPDEFQRALEHSFETKETLDVERYVQKFKSKKHDLFLIPHGTVHCSGINNMVLEISATTYLFTFKMYDWQRMDLDGKPRPINIDHAFKNLNFDRQGLDVAETLISHPVVESAGEGWKKVHLPTHADHFYDIYRYEFEGEIEIETLDQCHLLMLVEGESIELNVNGNIPHTFHYAETFAVPAAAGMYQLKNKGDTTAKVIVSFVKDEAC
ncbi:class I mannose-6-phosphate isomerase [Flavobacteriaceae bacterium F89]|uniref:Class I mannose-6-phosphate isomerase n=1 Tax=Cerina litoralis TaxID=2874477 RepID=A0AAE3EZZ8_9FLAO|nr:class I mannose-6-phosphate isomerase [Cerina litoralis]MCG2462787.1 class I mannose-6-phosphate isomerase [Cerina litoralis]